MWIDWLTALTVLPWLIPLGLFVFSGLEMMTEDRIFFPSDFEENRNG
jgi:hypothetical protein